MKNLLTEKVPESLFFLESRISSNEMDLDKDQRLVYGLLQEEKLEAFFSSFRSHLHVYKVEDLLHVTRNDLARIGVLSGPDIRRFEKVIGKVTKNAGLKGIFTKVLPKKQKQTVLEIPATVKLLEDFEPVIIKAEDLKLQEILGSGNFGEVYKAEWKRHLGGQENIIPVAVKCLKEDSHQSFLKEVSVLSQLDQKHENIIKLYGISILGDLIRMITEYAEQGSLLDKLQHGEILLISLLCQFAVQIASGMMYLEQKGLVHRDLAARNILVTAHNQVKISDFGLAKLVGKENQWIMTAAEALPTRWLAPECLLEGKFTSSSDVWSFGVVLWEMFSFGEFPWFNFNSREVIEKLKNGERLHEPDYCPSNIYSLVMKRCWAENPNDRMKFEEARSCLVNIHPTSSFAVTSQRQNPDMLSYTIGDSIIAIKPFQGAVDLWIGQNERTLEFGKYIKSDTQPFITKIPLSTVATVSPISTVNEIKTNANSSPEMHINKKSSPVTIPKHAPHLGHQKLNGRLSLDEKSLPATTQAQGIEPPKLPPRKLSHEAFSSRKDSLVSMTPGDKKNEPFYSTIDDVKKKLNNGENNDTPIERPSSFPEPDKLASGTFMRYPSMYVQMNKDGAQGSPPAAPTTSAVQISNSNERPKVPARPDLPENMQKQATTAPKLKKGTLAQRPLTSPSEETVRAKTSPDIFKSPNKMLKGLNDETVLKKKQAALKHRQESQEQNYDKIDNNLDKQFENLALREKPEKPPKPPRVSHGFYFDDSSLQNMDPDYENTDVFSVDPAAWVNDVEEEPPALPPKRSTRHRALRPSGGSEGSHLSALGDVCNVASLMKLHVPKKKYGSAERMKKLRKTQSLESLSFEQFEEEKEEPFDERIRAKTLYHDGYPGYIDASFESESSESDVFSSSLDNVSYKKLENETQATKRKTLFGLKLRKKHKKESSKSNPDDLPRLIDLVQLEMPDCLQSDIASALEISMFDAEDAVKFLKVKQLGKLGLCPQSACLDMLKTYDWNVLEASYAIKIHYLMAIHLDLSMEMAAKLLRQNRWDIDFVLRELRLPSFIEESEGIGFSEEQARNMLASVGNDIEKALCEMKARRVADITQQSVDYCRRTLEHCQWRMDRAINFIVESN